MDNNNIIINNTGNYFNIEYTREKVGSYTR